MARKQYNIFEWFSHTVCSHDSTVGICNNCSLYHWGCGQYHNYSWREDLKADVKDIMTLPEKMDEIKGMGSKVQLAHPRNSVRSSSQKRNWDFRSSELLVSLWKARIIDHNIKYHPDLINSNKISLKDNICVGTLTVPREYWWVAPAAVKVRDKQRLSIQWWTYDNKAIQYEDITIRMYVLLTKEKKEKKAIRTTKHWFKTSPFSKKSYSFWIGQSKIRTWQPIKELNILWIHWNMWITFNFDKSGKPKWDIRIKGKRCRKPKAALDHYKLPLENSNIWVSKRQAILLQVVAWVPAESQQAETRRYSPW